jgi:PIN domain nuclease of toxin-antitoxin system
MRVLLDTVTFIWAVLSPERLSSKSLSVLQNVETCREISSVSLSEIAIKQLRGKLGFSREEVMHGIADLQLRVLPYSAAHAFQLFELPAHHTDPFDRQIIAQAIAENIPVVTPDEKFRLYKGVRVVW